MLRVSIVELSRAAKAISRRGETAESEPIIVSPQREIALVATRIYSKKWLSSTILAAARILLRRGEILFSPWLEPSTTDR